MQLSELSASAQNYLKAIWNIQEWSETEATTSLIAKATGVKLPSVSDAMRKLQAQGLVNHERYGTVTLTELGRRHAVSMVRRHRLLETFLVETLQYSWDEVHEEAELLEHAASDMLIERMDAFLEFPARDPHGDPIPNANGEITFPKAVTVFQAPDNATLKVVRISDADPQLLQYLAEQGIGIDSILKLAVRSPFSEAVTVSVVDTGTTVSLGEVASSSIWAEELTD